MLRAAFSACLGIRTNHNVGFVAVALATTVATAIDTDGDSDWDAD